MSRLIDAFKLAQLPRDRPLKAKCGPAREVACAISGCPVDKHSYAVQLPSGAGVACTTCAGDAGFELDWSTV